jgi:hypothetical protein
MGWIKDRIDDLLFPFKRKKIIQQMIDELKEEMRNRPCKKNDEDS